ncbi:MAG: glycosyltransferase family 2 protein [Elusimicrobia bacterium]|nr:glycosyltransferase family 2 protein [Elusimicrobiota bacterium]
MEAGSEKIRLSVVVPAFNEEPGIAGVVSGLKEAMAGAGLKPADDFEILVVDDGSTDRTAELAEEAGARVLRHPTNRGYGRSLLSGFAAARFPWLLMIDADGSYPPEDAAKLLAWAPRFDMAVGARQGPLFWGGPIHTFLRWIYLVLASFVAGERVPDANSGLRLIRKEALDRSMPVLCYGYSLSTTMTLSFLQGGRFVAFVPVSYVERKGSSKVRSLRDIPRTLQIMVQVILYYNPLKFVVFLAFLPGALAAAFLVRFLASAGRKDFTAFCVCLFVTLGVFLVGCLLESLRFNRSRSELP